MVHSHKTDTHSEYGFAFLPCRTSASKTIQGLRECLIYRRLLNTASDQGTNFSAEEWEWAHDRELSCTLHHLELAGLRARQDGWLKAHLEALPCEDVWPSFGTR